MLRVNNLSGFGRIVPAPGGGGGYTAVTWTDKVNVTESPTGTLTKTGGSHSANDAGAFSVETFSGDGGVRMTHDSAWGNYWFGVSVNNDGPGGDTIDYAFGRLTSDWWIMENNSFKSNAGAQADNDVIEIRREGTTIKYYVNSSLVYTSATSNSSSLHADVGLYALDPPTAVVAGVEMDGMD